MRPIDLVKAAPWQRALLTTYSLSLSFFEAVLMDAFVRGGGRNPTIIADVEGVQNALSEMGARMVGREYELIPVHNQQGVFHPKVSVFLNDGDAHILVGSGNLTFGGWGGNLEVTDHFHAGKHPTVLRDLAEYFELLAASETITLGSPGKLAEFAEALRTAAGGAVDDGRVRLVHNVGQTIAERIREEAEKLGGAERVCFVSPFYDSKGSGVSDLARELKCEEMWGYAHPSGEVQGTRSSNWSHEAPELLRSCQIDWPIADDGRRLHAKLIEVKCSNGRLLLSGSANATRAALFGPNSELCVLRISDGGAKPWVLVTSDPPMRSACELEQEEEETGQRTNILSAELQVATITGQVLGPWAPGVTSISCSVAGDEYALGDMVVGSDGSFAIQAEGLASEAWRMGRMILTLDAGDRRAIGFVSVKAISDLSKRAGPVAAKILAVLTKTETPQDVAAILSWFYEDPSRLPSRSSGAWAAKQGEASTDQFVSFADFQVQVGMTLPTQEEKGSAANYAYAMKALIDAFRAASGTFEEENEASEEEGGRSEAKGDAGVRNGRAVEDIIGAFDKLLATALHEKHGGRHCETMLALANYLTERLRPEPKKVLGWLYSIQTGLRGEVSETLKSEFASIAILKVANDTSDGRLMAERRFLRRNRLLGHIERASFEGLSAFVRALVPKQPLKEATLRLLAARTHAEELELLLATRPEDSLPPLPALEKSALWPRLQLLHRDPTRRGPLLTVTEPVTMCPRCRITLATSASEDLRLFEVSQCTNYRCKRLIVVARDAHDA